MMVLAQRAGAAEIAARHVIENPDYKAQIARQRQFLAQQRQSWERTRNAQIQGIAPAPAGAQPSLVIRPAPRVSIPAHRPLK